MAGIGGVVKVRCEIRRRNEVRSNRIGSDEMK